MFYLLGLASGLYSIGRIKQNSQIKTTKILKQKTLLQQFQKMSSESESDSQSLNNPIEHIPLQYKIIDLPILPMPQLQTLTQFPCKIYRKTPSTEPNNAGQQLHEWKRRCYGRVKFVQNQGMIVVAAYQYGSCHIRLREYPVVCPEGLLYQLQQSQEFPHNWVYTNEAMEVISIALAAEDFLQFRTQWQNCKAVNTQKLALNMEEDWLNLISDDLFL